MKSWPGEIPVSFLGDTLGIQVIFISVSRDHTSSTGSDLRKFRELAFGCNITN